jgi:predicted aldo/keto reductase-like oxidoreductase
MTSFPAGLLTSSTWPPTDDGAGHESTSVTPRTTCDELGVSLNGFGMRYRRFGRTGLELPVISCGGMRYQQSWNPADAIGDDSQRNLEATVRRSLELGIHHIETARGYGTSEAQLGKILPNLPREQLVVQTKVAPTADPDEFVRDFEDSMRRLQLEYVDLLGLHGVNDAKVLEWSIRDGGCLERAEELRRQGRVRHIGFSTHAPAEVIVRGIEDGRFDYVNLHYYYVFQDNWPAVEAATARGMGVFIISPNDKGGRLYDPSAKLVELCAPLSPMVFNDLWCLTKPEIHTLSCGAARPSDFDEHVRAVALLGDDSDSARQAARERIAVVEARLRDEYERALGVEYARRWRQGLPAWEEMPGQINLREIVRLYNLAKAFDLVEYGRGRYNLLGGGGHWFPGNKLDRLDELELGPALEQSPFAERIIESLREARELFAGQAVKRLQRG